MSTITTSTIATLILNTTNQNSLAQTLHSTNGWTQELVHTIFKRLWNHGPKALLFFNLLDNHPSYSHSALAFDYAIDISARMRDYKSLWSLVDTMHRPRLGPSTKTFVIITQRLVSAGKPGRAVIVFLKMHQHGCTQDLIFFNTFLDVLCKSGRPEMAYKMFVMLRDRFRADVITFNVLVNGFCLVKEISRAVDLMRDMVERGFHPNVVTYNTMLKGYFRAGRVKDASDFFLQMKTSVVGEVMRAKKVFDEMIDAGVL